MVPSVSPDWWAPGGRAFSLVTPQLCNSVLLGVILAPLHEDGAVSVDLLLSYCQCWHFSFNVGGVGFMYVFLFILFYFCKPSWGHPLGCERQDIVQ